MIRMFAIALALAAVAGGACAQLDPQNMPAPNLPLTGTEIIPCDQNNGYKKCTVANFPQSAVSPKHEVEYFYGPSALTKASSGPGSQSSDLGAGNGITDVHGSVWQVPSFATFLLQGTTDTTDGNQFLRDWGTLPAASTPSGVNQTAVFDLDSTAAADTFVVFRTNSGTNTGYFVGANPTNGNAIIMAWNAGTQIGSTTTGTASGYVSGHTLRVTASISGSSPSAINVSVQDTTTGVVVATATLSDSTVALQTATASAIAIGNSSGVASAQNTEIQDFAIWDPTVVSKPLYAVFVGDSLTYGEKVSDSASNGGTIVGKNPAAQAIATLGSNWGGTNLGNQAQREDQMATVIASRLALLAGGRQQQWASMMSSINDAGQGYTAAQMEIRIVALAKAIRSSGFRLLISTILPLGSGCTAYNSFGTTPSGIDATLVTVNAWIKANWQNFADAFVDPLTDSRINAYNTTYWDTDQLHLNDTGSAILGGIWGNALLTAALSPPANPPTPWSYSVAPADGAVNTTITVPPGYSDLDVIVTGQSKAAAAYDTVNLQFNGDTAGHYDEQQIIFNNATSTSTGVVAQTSGFLGWLTGASGVSNGGGQVQAKVSGYAQTTFNKSYAFQSGVRTGAAASNMFAIAGWGDWNSAAAISSVTVNVPGGLKAGSRVTVRALP